MIVFISLLNVMIMFWDKELVVSLKMMLFKLYINFILTIVKRDLCLNMDGGSFVIVKNGIVIFLNVLRVMEV